jgi:hypothetical protein
MRVMGAKNDTHALNPNFAVEILLQAETTANTSITEHFLT